MKWDIDTILFIVNVLCTIFSCVGAYRSIKYYKKSKHLTTYAHKSVAYNEVKLIISNMTEILGCAAPRQGRGTNLEKKVSNLGLNIKISINTIREQLSNEKCEEILSILNSNAIENYIESLITSPLNPNGAICIGQEFRNCEKSFYDVQEKLKKKLDESEEFLSA